MGEYFSISLNMPENACINCSDYARVLSMLQYSYSNIIIFVTNVLILEFLPATILSFLMLVRKRE